MPDAAPDWPNTPAMDDADFHSKFGGQEWRYSNQGVFLRAEPDTPRRSPNEPKTCAAILAAYGQEICAASKANGVPPEIIVMTIAAETGANRQQNFTGPKTFRWEPGVRVKDVNPQTMGDYSAGPMQTLATTARDLIHRLNLPFQPFVVAPYFNSRPEQPPAMNPLYDGKTNIALGTAEIRSNLHATGLDPILVAACYNHGSLAASDAAHSNPWNLFTQGDHLNRASEWFGDACALLSALRQGHALDTGPVIMPPPQIDPDDDPRNIELGGLSDAQAQEEAAFYRDSGASVEIIEEEGGGFTVVVIYDSVPPAPPPPAVLNVQPPNQNGYVLCINRIRSERRTSKPFARTVGFYQAFFDNNPIAEIRGLAVERQGPGNNTQVGVHNHARLAQGVYSLFTHAGDNIKYRTFGFANPGGLSIRPWPCIGIGDTGARSGVLIHCAQGYLMSIGCINLTGDLANASSEMQFTDSRSRVIALIQSMKSLMGSKFPSFNNVEIPNAKLVIRGEP